MFSRILRLSLSLSALALACSSTRDDSTPKHGDSKAPPTDAPTVFEGSVGHRDPRLSVPSFVWFNRGDSALTTVRDASSATEAAKMALPSIGRALGVTTDAAMKSVLLSHVDDHGSNGPIVVRYEQRVGAVEVFRGGASLMLTRSLAPVAASGFLAPTLRGTERPFTLASIDALRTGARLLGASNGLSSMGEHDGYEHWNAPGLSSPARTKRVFFPIRNSATNEVELEPAFYVELMLASGAAHGLIVSALDGRVLLDNDFVRYDAFTYQVFADPESKLPSDGPQGNGIAPHPTGTPDHIKLTFEPSKAVTLQNYPFSKNDPWLLPTATTTNGNNVNAYADVLEPDLFQAGKDTAPALTGDKAFLHIYDTNASPNVTPASVQAAATNLFYITNFLHDWYYDAGFDEKAGNHQLDNFGRGGMGGDPLFAQAQDFSGRNNANAATPPDGTAPRIQMFIFSGATNSSLVVSAGPAAGTKSVGIANGFGDDLFDLTGTTVVADPADACEPIEIPVTGKIVITHRGTCSFAQKAANVQAAGGIGAIIANVASSSNPTSAPFMGGTQGGITIPVLSVNMADGQALEASAGSSITMKRAGTSDLDGALDTSIVAHEWGHVLSNRLIGNGMGLTTNQSGGLGEGWGDFVALLLTIRADDPHNFGGAYANGSYATSGSGDDIYYGVRRLPYSTDFAKNALTLKHIANGNALPTTNITSYGEDGSFNAEVHSAGEVWASMLLECYVTLLRDSGLSFTDAQDRMKRYLVAGMKLTPPDPTIIEARDAMLAAALAVDEKHFQLFWKAFAKRGAGAGALGPPKDSTSNQGIVESFEFGNDLQLVDVKLADDVISCDHDGILDEAEVGTIEVTIRNTGSGPLAATKAEVIAKTPNVSLFDTEAVTLPPLKPFESTKTKLKARITAQKQADPIELDIAVSDPSLPNAKVVHIILPTRYDADQAADASATDRVDTVKTAWKVAADNVQPGSTVTTKWARTSVTGDAVWQMPAPSQAGDHRLTSPTFTIAETSFTLAFKHQWQMKRSTRRNVDVDGGVIELSVDSGKTWKDLSDFGKVDYNTKIDTGGRGDNPLKGRPAYGGASPNHPKDWVNSRIDVTLPEHPEGVQIRFRVGSGSGRAGSDGWLIDDIELIGISSTPFWAFVPHADACDPNGPSVAAGPPQTVKSKAKVTMAATASHPAEKPLTILWTQVAGPKVTLVGADTLTPSFEAFDTAQPQTVTLALRAHDGALLSAASKVDITVEAPDAPPPEGCGCRTTSSTPSRAGSVLGLLLAAAFATRRLRRRP